MKTKILTLAFVLFSFIAFSQSDGDLLLAETNFFIGEMSRTITLTDLSTIDVTTKAYFRTAQFDKDNAHITVYFYDITPTDTIRYQPPNPIVFNSVNDPTEHNAVYNTTVRDIWLPAIRQKIIDGELYLNH